MQEDRLFDSCPGRPAPSSSPGTSSCGPTRRASSSTSPGRASRPTMHSSSRFNGKFRAECLNAHWFLSLDDAKAKTGEWRKDYNLVS
ncbi:MAG: hypothetical protein EOQ36_31215 [Mesorhizobium sp.]|nr:MAG: hypothetical protein EOQ36_31215 [Mesorhizobium sp.]TJW49692.1 MAG: hypothetical protein E5X65_32185 [Mesorhizobium sp.]